MRHWKKVDELKDLGCYVRGKFYDLSWSKPVLRAPAVHSVSKLVIVSNKAFAIRAAILIDPFCVTGFPNQSRMAAAH